MNMLKNIVCLSAAIMALGSLCAQPRHPLQWEASPKLHIISDSLKREPAVFILKEQRIQMESVPGADFAQYYTTHYIIHLNDDKGAESFNTFTIPVLPGTKLWEIKARTILPGGKVAEVSRDKVKKITSERGLPEYLVAMEGITRGVEVELLYTEILPGSATGTEVYQHRIPVQKAVFSMYVPENMVYEAKGYNGFPTPAVSITDDQRIYTATGYNIPALDDEKDSRYRALLQRVDYKLSYVARTEHAKDRRMSWPEMARELYRKYGTFGERSLSIADEVLAKAGVKRNDEEAAKIIAIEDYFKKTFTITNGLSDEHATDFEQTIAKKVTTEKGFVRLFAACLNAAGVKYEVGMVGNRFHYGMDDSLELWEHLEEYCFYFPRLNTYLVPAAMTCRYPFVPYQVAGAKGVFTKKAPSESGEIKAVPDYRTVPPASMTASGVNLTASVRFEGKDLLPVVNTSIAFKGYSAEDLRGPLLSASVEKHREALQSIMELSDKAEDFQDVTVENTAYRNYTTGKPLIISATIHAPKLMEKAGPKYLFRAGDLIGRQTDLYDATERKLPVETGYPNEQLRTLRISIPQGYKVANPEALRTRASCMIAGAEACGFTSDFKTEGSDIIVTIREFYTRTDYPLPAYEGYRKVINAAADFNKVVLVLQKG